MMEPELKPAPRAMRLLLITPAAAAGVLWAVRDFVPKPWMVVDLLGKDLWGIAWQARHPNYQFRFNGRWVTPGWHWFPESFHYLSHDWKATLMIAGALFIGGTVAVIVDRLALKWNTATMRSIK